MNDSNITDSYLIAAKLEAASRGGSKPIFERRIGDGLTNRVAVSSSCEQGIYGACVTKVIDGIPKHHDFYLTEDDNRKGDKMCICVSRSNSLTLKLDI